MFLKPLFPVVDYVVNYDYISQVLCINKAKPELKCNGKCHLMQELAKTTQEDKSISSNKKQNTPSLVDLFITNVDSFSFLLFQNQKDYTLNSRYTNWYSHLRSTSIFRPPLFIF
ncbi:hypothetical protein LPBF_03830 [Flavobacterium crassostreae]|uniref:Uncharacterized protein n=1 Tax=Flavobacterium crassostreae TaxID=1763534 RepID=A0A1B9E852_9FLAO|nr:hypothetical protein LPBF_03830 [Flavobacterium crassostreae]